MIYIQYDGAFNFQTAKDSNPKPWFSGYHFINFTSYSQTNSHKNVEPFKKPVLFIVHTKNATILTVMICTYLEGFVSPHQDANHLCDFVF